MEREDDKQLWDLLGRNKAPAVSPFFARNVLRQIRQKPGWKSTLGMWLKPKRLVPLTSLAAVILAGVLVLQRVERPAQPAPDSDPIAKIDPQDYDVVSDLDNLLAAEDSTLWDDDNSTL